MVHKRSCFMFSCSLINSPTKSVVICLFTYLFIVFQNIKIKYVIVKFDTDFIKLKSYLYRFYITTKVSVQIKLLINVSCNIKKWRMYFISRKVKASFAKQFVCKLIEHNLAIIYKNNIIELKFSN